SSDMGRGILAVAELSGTLVSFPHQFFKVIAHPCGQVPRLQKHQITGSVRQPVINGCGTNQRVYSFTKFLLCIVWGSRLSIHLSSSARVEGLWPRPIPLPHCLIHCPLLARGSTPRTA